MVVILVVILGVVLIVIVVIVHECHPTFNIIIDCDSINILFGGQYGFSYRV